MSAHTLEKIRSEALNLSESERAEFAHSLVTSLDGPADQDAGQAWDAEIQRRLAEIDTGTAHLDARFRRAQLHARRLQPAGQDGMLSPPLWQLRKLRDLFGCACPFSLRIPEDAGLGH